ncbi:MAG: hypothetical protein UU40_C0003G0006 [Candidatus Uhrbacteria bacterium GW2011_GWD2_41_121]|uniref:UPF0251 protein UU50_C0003G0006 n=1 Tax=Candidatus Uhrbacteria bacterium GW2011_GWC1_41_20 TaxID=1618983 RepID=A0A0G0VJC9_9BACT|nr:MAG: hypothetical protein UT52_C0003G0006 [Candidatus Uhrbacteria bacterium GW2011_GWE1_39_46]KKR64266.1 MAG: hypothetical protein UU04_C0003G0006 [Candidatus Uhrbacteria bacterium GW2011_GWC2_40_450]KKR90436.1 MAG: hypothetical protein UU40_C0003G0006 [Candidatus Uhrbacteria bacterium GW2011_GWD2_41_121]KKR96201.1 MAG: hypothetical protein UU46_C0006G0032 [Candidatus Uhrbacteria bacterium GW2011_GWD1_41_16]KKR99701.1 MAG: hypothetical protein UU50_C0003G0006 [Candidatus Uhrbacteria bacteriu
MKNNDIIISIKYMPRPRLCRKIEFNPSITFFKPQGIPMRELEIVELTAEEIEAYRLRHDKNMEQTKAAKKMQTSQSTYQRILISANKKIADALINGKAIKIKVIT